MIPKHPSPLPFCGIQAPGKGQAMYFAVLSYSPLIPDSVSQTFEVHVRIPWRTCSVSWDRRQGGGVSRSEFVSLGQSGVHGWALLYLVLILT